MGLLGAFFALSPFVRFLRAVDSGDRLSSATLVGGLLVLVVALGAWLARRGCVGAGWGWAVPMVISLALAVVVVAAALERR